MRLLKSYGRVLQPDARKCCLLESRKAKIRFAGSLGETGGGVDDSNAFRNIAPRRDFC